MQQPNVLTDAWIRDGLDLELECAYVNQIIDILATAPKELWRGILITLTRWVDAELDRD